MGPIFTFSADDGHPSDMKLAELLDKHGLKGTFFVPIHNREGRPVMSKEQLRGIRDKFEIGSHTYDHCYLSNLGQVEANRQITEGKTRLENLLGQQVTGFCYPGGKYRRSDLVLVEEAGFAYARTTTNLCFEPGNSRLELPTTIQFYPHSSAVYCRNFALAGRWIKRSSGLRLAVQHQNWIQRMYALFDYSCQHDGVFHLWAHSYEIDQLHAWSQLGHFFAYVSSKVTVENRLTNQQLASKRF